MKKLRLILFITFPFFQSCQEKGIELPMRIESRLNEAHKFYFQKESRLWKRSRTYDYGDILVYQDSAVWTLSRDGGKRRTYSMKEVFSGEPISNKIQLNFIDSTIFTIDPILMKKNYEIIKKSVAEREIEVIISYSKDKNAWVVWIKSETQGFLIIGDSKPL